MTAASGSLGRLGDGRHRLPAVVERAFDRFRDEFVTRLEMPIEAAMRQPGVVHQVGHAHPVDPVLAEAGRGHADDLLRGARVCLAREWPMRLRSPWLLTA